MSINIKPENVGSLRAHLGTPEGEKIPVSELSDKPGDSEAIRKKKNFARNARKWGHAEGGEIFNYMNGGKTMPSGPYNNMQYKTSFKNGGMNKGPYNNMNYKPSFNTGGENPKFYDEATQEYYPGPDWIPGGKIGDAETTKEGVTEGQIDATENGVVTEGKNSIYADNRKVDEYKDVLGGGISWPEVGKDMKIYDNSKGWTAPKVAGDDEDRIPLTDSLILSQYMRHKNPGSQSSGGGYAGSSGGGYLQEDGTLSDENRDMMVKDIKSNYGFEYLGKKIKEGVSSIWDYIAD